MAEDMINGKMLGGRLLWITVIIIVAVRTVGIRLIAAVFRKLADYII